MGGRKRVSTLEKANAAAALAKSASGPAVRKISGDRMISPVTWASVKPPAKRLLAEMSCFRDTMNGIEAALLVVKSWLRLAKTTVMA